MIDFEIDVEHLIKERAARHGVCDRDIDALLLEIDGMADKIGIDPTSMYLILLDSLSGEFVCSRDDIVHQVKVMLTNSNRLKYLPC